MFPVDLKRRHLFYYSITKFGGRFLLASSSPTVAGRIRRLLLVLVLACAIPVGIYIAAGFECVPWPRASDPWCILLGVLAGLFILFEMTLWLRKYWRGNRWLAGSTRWWTKWHVWVGILSLPAAVVHSGFSLGGTLSAWFMVLFALTIFSGVWGTVMQQWLPAKLLEEFPDETIVAGMGIVSRSNEREIDGLINTIIGNDENDFFRKDLKHYIVDGKVPAMARLDSADQSRILFDQLRRVYASDKAGRDEGERLRKLQRQDVNRRQVASSLLEAVAKPEELKVLAAINHLELLADERRSWTRQKKVHFWLHSWLVIHVPLSFAVLILLFAHAIFALKLGW